MIDEQGRKMSNDGVIQRSFRARPRRASLPIVAAARQTKDLSRDTHTGVSEQEIRLPERASASSGGGEEAGGGGEWSGSQYICLIPRQDGGDHGGRGRQRDDRGRAKRSPVSPRRS
jgi:hypothetical protein